VETLAYNQLDILKDLSTIPLSSFSWGHQKFLTGRRLGIRRVTHASSKESEADGKPGQNNKENTVNSRNMICTAALAVACLFSTTAVHGQAAAGAASGTKIGTINIRQAIVTTAEGKQASAELQSQFAAQQNELEALNKQINDLRQQLAANATTWGDDQKARAAAQGQRLTAKFDRQNTALQEDVNAAQSEVVDRIGRKMMDVIERYARENGFVAVFEYPAQNTSVVYASTNVDITAEIIKLYDQAYPAKAGTAPTTKPPATTPKPATQPPATTPKPAAPTKP
jgi:outer membrane protein